MVFLMENGGFVMWMILVFSITMVGIFFERLFHFHRAKIVVNDFLGGIYNVLKKKNPAEAISLCGDTPGPVAQIVRAAILHHDEDITEIREAVENAGSDEIPRLERNLPLMASIIRTLPLLGLLGTVVGFINSLRGFEQAAPLVHIGDVSGGMWTALLTSAAAMAVAIPGYIAYQFLLTRMQRILLDMEYAAADVTSFFSANRFKLNPLVEEDTGSTVDGYE